jgi:hypothetical protein
MSFFGIQTESDLPFIVVICSGVIGRESRIIICPFKYEVTGKKESTVVFFSVVFILSELLKHPFKMKRQTAIIIYLFIVYLI